MKIKQTIIACVFALSLALGSLSFVNIATAATCGGADTAIISCTQGKGATTAQDSGVWALLLLALNIMTAGVGILAVGGIVYGSILYTTAADKAEQTKKAVGIITNVVIGVVAYGLMFVLLNFLVPGGIFTS
ncbi:MAG: hypothetical protein ACHQTE_02610 [Candidatus Saccharimonadales bacterium]